MTLCQHQSCINGEKTLYTLLLHKTVFLSHFSPIYLHLVFHLLTMTDFILFFFPFPCPLEPAMPGIWHSLLTRPWLWTGSWLNRMAWKTSSSRKSRLLLLLLALLCASLLPTPSWLSAGSEAASPREGPFLLQSFVSSWPLSLLWETVPELCQLWPPTFR